MTSHSCWWAGERSALNEVLWMKLCMCRWISFHTATVYVCECVYVYVCMCVRDSVKEESGEMMGWYSWFFKQLKNSTTRWCAIACSEEAIIIRVLLYHSDRAPIWSEFTAATCVETAWLMTLKNMLFTTYAIPFPNGLLMYLSHCLIGCCVANAASEAPFPF